MYYIEIEVGIIVFFLAKKNDDFSLRLSQQKKDAERFDTLQQATKALVQYVDEYANLVNITDIAIRRFK